MTKILVAAAVAVAFGAVLPAGAFAAGAPEKLSDVQLDGVRGGAGPSLFAPVFGPPVMRLPVVGPTVLENPELFLKTTNFYLGATTSGGALPVPALSQQQQVQAASGR